MLTAIDIFKTILINAAKVQNGINGKCSNFLLRNVTINLCKWRKYHEDKTWTKI